jgi:hypothetical protein
MYRVREKGWQMSVECIESGETGWRMSVECIESGETGWRMSANVSSPTYFQKLPFWQVLEFAKTGEFLASTQIRQIRRRVAIA